MNKISYNEKIFDLIVELKKKSKNKPEIYKIFIEISKLPLKKQIEICDMFYYEMIKETKEE